MHKIKKLLKLDNKLVGFQKFIYVNVLESAQMLSCINIKCLITEW